MCCGLKSFCENKKFEVSILFIARYLDEFQMLAEKIFIEEWTETVYIKSIAWRLYDDSCSGFTKLQADDVLQSIMQLNIDSLPFLATSI